MPLQPDPNCPGLWTDAKCDGVGAHALIIGLSDYQFLNGTTAAGRMKPLVVSARSAANLFSWLRNRGSIGGVPLASCRLVLAPVPSERAYVDGVTAGNYGEGTFKTLRRLTEDWGGDLFNARKRAGDNVALFFFSGHGIEHLTAPSLLAADVLNPNVPDRGNLALNLNDIMTAVKTYGAKRAFFFVDACRNDPEVAKKLSIFGQRDVLRPDPEATSEPENTVVLRSTSLGAFAYQHPDGSGTLFCQALMAGLEGVPDDYEPYDRDIPLWRLRFGRLSQFVIGHINELMEKHSSILTQAARAQNDNVTVDPVVVEGHPRQRVDLGVVAVGAGAVVGRLGLFSSNLVDRHLGSSLSISMPERESADVKVTKWSKSLNAGFTKANPSAFPALTPSFEFSATLAGAGDLGNSGVMHAALGGEMVTGPWIGSVSVLDLYTGTAAGYSFRVVGGQYHVQNRRWTCWVDGLLQPDEGRVTWIQVAPDAGPGLAVALPRDRTQVPIRLEIVFSEIDNNFWRPSALSARLSPSREAIWHDLWTLQELEGLGDMALAVKTEQDLALLESVVDQKQGCPLGAAMAISQLLQAGALDHLHHWPRNLANWFEWLPDGPVLWAETLLRRQVPGYQPPHEALEYFLAIVRRGPPLLTPVLAMAARQAEFWRARNESLPPEFELAEQSIATATDAAISDGWFAAFVDNDIHAVRQAVASTRATRWTVAES